MTSGVFFPPACAHPRPDAPGRLRHRARATPGAPERRCRHQAPVTRRCADPRPEFIGHEGRFGYRASRAGLGHQGSARDPLLNSARRLRGTVPELTGELLAAQPPVVNELAQDILGGDVHYVIELFDKISRFPSRHDRGSGGQQRAVRGEPHVSIRPQTELIEVGELIECVVAPAMGVAGAVSQFFELATYRTSGAGTQRGHQLRQGGNRLLTQQRHDGV